MKNDVTKSLSVKKLSIIATVATLIVPLVVVYIALGIQPDDKWPYLIFSLLIVFLVNYITISYLLGKYILMRIKPIYTKINSLDTFATDLDGHEDKDLIADADSKVIVWAKQKAKENKQLRETDILRREFIGNVAHELKTPIFNIQGYIDTLLDGGIYDDEINMKYLERTEKNVARLIATIKDVDTISRLESGRVMLEYTDFDIVELIFELFELQERLTTNYRIALEYLGPREQPIYVRADRDKTYEVLNNLIVNSIKYGIEGGRTRISIKPEADKVWVSVADNGIGIPPEHQPHIFTRFYRVDKSRSRERGGSGLGLAIVKHIIEAHGQTIQIQSEVNRGTTFRFSLKRGEE